MIIDSLFYFSGLKIWDSFCSVSLSWKENGFPDTLPYSFSGLLFGDELWGFYLFFSLCSSTSCLMVGFFSAKGEFSSLFLCSVGVRLGKGLFCLSRISVHSSAILGEDMRNNHLIDLRFPFSNTLIRIVRVLSLGVIFLRSFKGTLFLIRLISQLSAIFLESNSLI